MKGCVLQFSRNSSLRTTLVDEATGHATYEINTPIRLTGSVTRIRKFDSPTHPPEEWHDDTDSDNDDGGDGVVADKERKLKSHEDKKGALEEDKPGPELPKTDDEIARIYWQWFSPDKFVFHTKETTRDVFMPKCGKVER